MSDCAIATLIISIISFIGMIVVVSLYTDPKLPKLSIEDFYVPTFNKTSDQTAGDIYFDLKLRNMNKAIGLYYDEPFSVAFSYYPLDEPYQKYVWECTVPPFYQGNGKTKHVRSFPRLPSTVVVDKEEGNTGQLVDIAPDLLVVDELATVSSLYQGNGETKHVRSLLGNHLRLPSTMVDDEARQDLVAVEKAVPAAVVTFRINLIVNLRFKLMMDPSTHELEVAGDVVVDANTGEKVSKGSIQLKSDAAAGTPLVVMVIFASFLLLSM